MTGPYAFGDRIDQLVGRHAAATPAAIAVEQGRETLDYGTLWRRSGSVAVGLADRAVGGGDVVAVHLPRSPDRVVALLGVLRSGAAYVALDPAWPEERRADVIARSRAALVIGEAELAELAATEPRPLPEPADGTAPASVFYTSGSTGRPKGVVVTHRGCVRILVGCPTLPMAADTVFLQAAPVPWDMHSFELWGALVNGGRAVLLDRDAPALDLDALRTAIDSGVNTLWLTSSLFNVFADEAPEVFRGVRLLAVGGEKVSPAHMRRALAAAPDVLAVNGYGPAECSMLATSHVIRRADVEADDVPIGKPLPHTGFLLLDGAGRRVADGPGEIALTGDGLAVGYLGDPEETARRFVEVDGRRCYRTGDVGVVDDEGLLRYRGRADRQVKVHGVRVEPGEVETALVAHPDVTAARVAAVPGHGALGCVYTTVDGAPLPVPALREFLGRTLVSAMIPTVLAHVARMPLGATGKVDPGAVARLLAETAGPASEVDPETDVIAAGMSSLDAVRLAARLSVSTGGRITVADVYRLRTRAAIEAHGRANAERTDRITPTTAAAQAPLSRAQERFWLAEQTAPGACDNLIVLAWLLRGPLDVDRLAAALRTVVDRHPVLRTVYPWDGDLPVQRVLDTGGDWCPLERVDAPPGLPVGDVAAHVTADWWDTPFDLEAEIPVGARLVDLTGDTHLLCLRFHHVAFDGWSERVLLADLRAAYAGEPPPAGAVTYADYGAWERDRLDRWARADLPHWRRVLADPPKPFLPAPAAADEEVTRHELVLRIPAGTVRAATEAANGLAVAALVAAAGRALSGTFGVADVCVGTATAGRFVPEAEELVGYFVNPVPVVLTAVADRSLDGVVDEVLTALDHTRTPFDELVRVLRPDRDRHPWFQVWAVMQSPRPHGELAPGLTVEPVRVRPPRTALELMFDTTPQPDGSWEVVLLWRADGISADTAGELLSRLHKAVAELPITG
ncbi:amino acid adenylation domain-containing protein [Actinophytocola sp. NPDC049390]|uniref:amino acid adenylation domain-containing protein n=1 Tax=Actinophytocola sp. NPDC049390 TaxID=3363894 RepID=UPI0037B010DE